MPISAINGGIDDLVDLNKKNSIDNRSLFKRSSTTSYGSGTNPAAFMKASKFNQEQKGGSPVLKETSACVIKEHEEITE